MEEISQGEFFELNTQNRKEAMKKVLQKLKTGPKDKGNLVTSLLEEEVYKQKKDCKDFLKNCIKCENHPVVETGRREVSLPSETEVV